MGHTYEYRRKKKAVIEGGQAHSRGNHVTTMNDKMEVVASCPFSQEEC